MVLSKLLHGLLLHLDIRNEVDSRLALAVDLVGADQVVQLVDSFLLGASSLLIHNDHVALLWLDNVTGKQVGFWRLNTKGFKFYF